jgi:hypothetical protein
VLKTKKEIAGPGEWAGDPDVSTLLMSVGHPHLINSEALQEKLGIFKLGEGERFCQNKNYFVLVLRACGVRCLG